MRLLGSYPTLFVLEYNNNSLTIIGVLNTYTSLLWVSRYLGPGEAEVWAPVNEENKDYFKEGNIIWDGKDQAMMVASLKVETTELGERKYHVKLEGLEKLLGKRINWGIYNAYNKYVSDIAYELVELHCTNPINLDRKIPYLTTNSTKTQLGQRLTFQNTGGNILEVIETLFSGKLGTYMRLDLHSQNIIFEVVEGTNKTSEIELSTVYGDILTSSYFYNPIDERTIARVGGEGEGSERMYEVAGDEAKIGLNRKELFIDARDLQSTYQEDGQEVVIPVEEYKEMLRVRGREYLDKNAPLETFESRIRVLGNVQFILGEDYLLGDVITIRDKDIGVTTFSRVVSIEEEISSSGYKVSINVGHERATIKA